MTTYIKLLIRNFIGLDTDYESLLTNQEQILEKLEKLEQLEQLEIQNKKLISDNENNNYYDYLTVKNALWVLFLLALIGSGFWLYNSDLFNVSTISNIDPIKSLIDLPKDIINNNGILRALKKLNENSVDLSKEEIELLLKIKSLLLRKGLSISENPNLDKPVDIIYSTKGGFVWDEQS
jgi:hypothetical protein